MAFTMVSVDAGVLERVLAASKPILVGLGGRALVEMVKALHQLACATDMDVEKLPFQIWSVMLPMTVPSDQVPTVLAWLKWIQHEGWTVVTMEGNVLRAFDTVQPGTEVIVFPPGMFLARADIDLDEG